LCELSHKGRVVWDTPPWRCTLHDLNYAPPPDEAPNCWSNLPPSYSDYGPRAPARPFVPSRASLEVDGAGTRPLSTHVTVFFEQKRGVPCYHGLNALGSHIVLTAFIEKERSGAHALTARSPPHPIRGPWVRPHARPPRDTGGHPHGGPCGGGGEPMGSEGEVSVR